VIILGIVSVGTSKITEGIEIGPNWIKDGIGSIGPKLIKLGIGGSKVITDGIFIFGIPISKIGNTIGGILIIGRGISILISISSSGSAGHSGIWINTGSGGTGIFGSVGFSLLIGVWTILQLLVSTFTTGSIGAEIGYKWVPLNWLVVETPSPKSILKAL
jgi:hypothetical protein